MKQLWLEKINDSFVKSFFQQQSKEEQDEGFQTKLSFGTAGIRGKFGLGEGRLNKYTVAKVALGLAQYLKQQATSPSVVIHYDIRHLSPEFSQLIAQILASHDITVYLPNTYKTTPELSFAVRYMKASAGIMITASHNPKDYNGIKVYGADGAQIDTTIAESLSNYIDQIGDPLSIDITSVTTHNNDFIQTLDNSVTQHYIQQVIKLTDHIPQSNLKVVFTSLHGTSVPIVPTLLDDLSFTQYTLVQSQCIPDSNFSSVKSANPEDHQSFDQSIDIANDIGADLMISTDPDADRFGLVERDADGTLYYFNGNQIGALLLNYRIKQTAHLNNRLMIQSIVSSELAKSLARYHNVAIKEVLTGFKYIAEEIRALDKQTNFIFGYEESYGYLAEAFVRDKDAVQIVPLLIRYAAELKNNNRMLKDELNDIYAQVGMHEDKLFSHTFEGLAGKEKIATIMDNFRNATPNQINGLTITTIEDYLTGVRTESSNGKASKITLPRADVIKIYFKEGFIALRPSGTEPKIKLYISLSCSNFDQVANDINTQIFN
ncbi:phospho-sugar mutase [Staphylococcus simiae]|uniref:phospho-sugar mutase n=1 Tax=Staphylococcus simiae TaxID=308354 RepID=UPI001A95D3E3|nr:phospho-sugar mutase [Staphylococcus simiae]MBO1199752.1 phospho-sugar mutase [Staphylococcus simiae]MBO1201860.1 phospho-sugar mutase [Staphylococcus simiae]MBO1204074.1 phospho-sugar mutase [Staphylococcus simiae]MBO1211116.1 phospho-sugar mutase [Staphylococcus simiae]MBO1230312.1 phospho-sugar mutase [Staphylococcus simiae]